MKKIHLKEPIFEGGEEIKVGYLNINNLLDGYHAEYLNGDHNLKSLDLLAISETHLTQTVSTEQVQIVLSKWDIKARYDSPDHTKHMGLLLVSPKGSVIGQQFKVESSCHLNKGSQTQVQTIQCSIRENSFSFVYSRATPTLPEAVWLQEKTAGSCYLMGDLNLDPCVQDQKNKISIICGQSKISLLNETTTKNKRQLDHILGVKGKNVTIFTTSFHNFVSDHKAVTMRISVSGDKFVEDQRLQVNIKDLINPDV